MRVIEDPAIDAVMITSPTSTHRELVLRPPWSRGRRLFCEKPLAPTFAEVRELCARGGNEPTPGPGRLPLALSPHRQPVAATRRVGRARPPHGLHAARRPVLAHRSGRPRSTARGDRIAPRPEVGPSSSTRSTPRTSSAGCSDPPCGSSREHPVGVRLRRRGRGDGPGRARVGGRRHHPQCLQRRAGTRGATIRGLLRAGRRRGHHRLHRRGHRGQLPDAETRCAP